MIFETLRPSPVHLIHQMKPTHSYTSGWLQPGKALQKRELDLNCGIVRITFLLFYCYALLHYHIMNV